MLGWLVGRRFRLLYRWDEEMGTQVGIWIGRTWIKDSELGIGHRKSGWNRTVGSIRPGLHGLGFGRDSFIHSSFLKLFLKGFIFHFYFYDWRCCGSCVYSSIFLGFIYIPLQCADIFYTPHTIRSFLYTPGYSPSSLFSSSSLSRSPFYTVHRYVFPISFFCFDIRLLRTRAFIVFVDLERVWFYWEYSFLPILYRVFEYAFLV